MRASLSLILASLSLGLAGIAFSQEQKPLSLTERPLLEYLMAAGMHALASSDQTHRMEPAQTDSGAARRVIMPAGLKGSANPDHEVPVPQQELEMGRSLYSGPVTPRLATGGETVMEYLAHRVIAYFPSQEVTIPENFYPPTPMVTKGSRARELNFFTIDRTAEDLKVLARLIEATALEPESFTAWVDLETWKHAPEYSRNFETEFGELNLHVTSDGLLTTDGERLIGKHAALRRKDVEDAKLRFHLTVTWRDDE